ncbi:MAG: flagellar basal body-associated FliL family protein [Nitrospiraceae bacterium]|nr:flagellar basal body-associated FliL family protein [Nitrospiraceae bacterium]
MENEKTEAAPQEEKKPARKRNIKPVIIVVAAISVIVLFGIGGYMGYTKFAAAREKGKGAGEGKHTVSGVMVPVDPFVVNLSDAGRYLKVTMQFEVGEGVDQNTVTAKMPQLRDAIITLISSKSADAVAGPEGKAQLKDEILLRANQAVGGDIFKNLYFTDFVMQ